MSQNAKRLHRRAPRYRISGGDPDSIKFLHLDNKKIILAKIYDISETGMAILVSNRNAPRTGEIIKIEFTPPGAVQIATLAHVIRIERDSRHHGNSKFPDTIKVGLAYHGLPLQYQQMLRSRMQTILGHNYNRLKGETLVLGYKDLWIVQHLWSVLVSLGLMIMLIWGIKSLNNQDPDLSPNKRANNSDWAEGFFQKAIPKK